MIPKRVVGPAGILFSVHALNSLILRMSVDENEVSRTTYAERDHVVCVGSKSMAESHPLLIEEEIHLSQHGGVHFPTNNVRFLTGGYHTHMLDWNIYIHENHKFKLFM